MAEINQALLTQNYFIKIILLNQKINNYSMLNKLCAKCKKQPRHLKDCYCKMCRHAICKEYDSKNKETLKLKRKIYCNKNAKKERERKAFYYEINSEYIKQRQKNWLINNQGKNNANSSKRRAAKYNATPSWLSKNQYKEIQEFYIEAKNLYWLSEGGLEVDHIIPLRGRNVCGLYVPWNLRIIPKKINRKKSNKME